MQASDRVIVGLPSTPGRSHVLEWAAEEADRYGDPLLVIRCSDDAAAATADLRTQSEPIRSRLPGLVLETAVSTAPPADELLSHADRARLIVVGAPRPNTGLSHIIGESTAAQVAMRAPCSVAVIPRGRVGELRDHVVVGVNGSAAGTTALQQALAEARRRRSRLLVVGVKGGAAKEPADTAERRLLGLELQAWIAAYPDIPVDYEIRRGDTAEELMAASASADLLVIGERAHPGFLGVRETSSTPLLFTRSPCPLLIVRETTVERVF